VSEEIPVREIELRPKRGSGWKAVFTGLATGVITAFFFAAMIREDRNAPDEAFWINAFAVVIGGIIGIAVWSASRQTPPPAILRLEPESIRWRSSLGAEIQLPYSDIWAAYRQGRGAGETLVFKDRAKGTLMVPVSGFSEPGLAASVLDEVRGRMSRLPEGDERLAALARRDAVAEALRTTPKPVTIALISLLVLIFAAEMAMGALEDPFRLLAFGANSPFLVRTGDWFRLATANLLHGGFIHLYFNLYALFVFGFTLEPLLGSARLLVFFLISSLAGAAGSVMLATYDMSLGASTGIFGLFAVEAFVLWRWKNEGLQPPSKRLWWSIALAFVLPAILVRHVDHMGHMAGFATGLGLAAASGRGELLDLRSRHRRTYLVLAVLLSALFLTAAGITVRRLADPAEELEIAGRLLRGRDLSPTLLNNAAWRVVASRSATHVQLEDALATMKDVVKRDPKSPEARDTLATAHFRLGHAREAVVVEREALASADTPVYATQLARFELALVESGGPLLLGERPARLPQARLLGDGSTQVDLGDASALSGATLHFVAADPRGPLAHLELIVGSEESALAQYEGQPTPPLPPDARILLTLVDSRERADPPAESIWRLRQTTSDAGRLP
jgi:rhomboid protease GluP